MANTEAASDEVERKSGKRSSVSWPRCEGDPEVTTSPQHSS
ncbi:MAG: hypothetical protein NO130_03960 [Sulfolobales archaeon]|nr:hypothetical protein [Sulfolobales archaeon]